MVGVRVGTGGKQVRYKHSNVLNKAWHISFRRYNYKYRVIFSEWHKFPYKRIQYELKY